MENKLVYTVRDGDFSLGYIQFGAGERALVLLPGLNFTEFAPLAEAIAAQYKKAAEKYTVYLFERPTDVCEGCQNSDIAEDTARAMRLLHLESADVVGFSQGGMIAQCLAAAHPELVRAVVLASSLSRNNATSKAVFDQWIAWAERHEALPILRDFARKLYTPALAESLIPGYEAMAPDITDAMLDRFAIFARACRDFDFYDRLHEIRCPMLAIGAENDTVLTAEATREVAEKTGCECFVYEGYGHAVYDEAPDYLDRLLDFFIRSSCGY